MFHPTVFSISPTRLFLSLFPSCRPAFQTPASKHERSGRPTSRINGLGLEAMYETWMAGWVEWGHRMASVRPSALRPARLAGRSRAVTNDTSDSGLPSRAEPFACNATAPPAGQVKLLVVVVESSRLCSLATLEGLAVVPKTTARHFSAPDPLHRRGDSVCGPQPGCHQRRALEGKMLSSVGFLSANGQEAPSQSILSH